MSTGIFEGMYCNTFGLFVGIQILLDYNDLYPSITFGETFWNE